MSEPPKGGRVGWGALLVLLPMLLVGAYFVYGAAEEEELDGPEGARIGAVRDRADDIPPTPPEEGGWRRHDFSAERPLPPVAPREGPSPGDPEDQDAVWDPQRRTSERSFPDTPGDAGVVAPFAATEHAARIVSVSGERAIEPSAECDVRVLPVGGRGFNCLVRVMCGGELLYPNQAQTAGFVRCEVEAGQAAAARDDGTTASDGDPRITLDLRTGAVVVSDEGEGVEPFSATLQIR